MSRIPKSGRRGYTVGIIEDELKTMEAKMSANDAKRTTEAQKAHEGESIELPMPTDFHVHVRQGPMLAAYVRRVASVCGRAIIMPNTTPPIASAQALLEYRRQIEEAASGMASNGAAADDAAGGVAANNAAANDVTGNDVAANDLAARGNALARPGFVPLMTFKLLPGMSAHVVEECARAGALAGKYYPAGTTTNAADGPRRPADVAAALGAMEAAGLVLCVHAERPGASSFDREKLFLPDIDFILENWPRLRVIIEHVSSRETVDYILAGPDRLAGTITAHHLLFTVDNMLGESLDPSLFCKPLIKFEEDREALRAVAFSASPRFFFGSDSAPHSIDKKLGRRAPAGVYAAPTAVSALVELFEAHDALSSLPAFWAYNGERFYGLPPLENAATIRLVREPWVVPDDIDGCIPLCAGKTLSWRIVS